MKKKLAAIALVLVMMVSFGIPVFAADSGFHVGQTSLAINVGESAALVSYYDTYPAVGTMWSSSNPDVATVDGYGNVTGVSLGKTVITANSALGESSCCYVHVVLKGIDVSSWQTSIDWSAVKNSGIDFAMIRTGLGSSESSDSKFDTYYAGAVANGLKVGAYHVAYATNVAVAQQEADFCLQILNGRHLDFPVAYDLETKAIAGLSTDTIGQIVNAFCNRINQAGYKTMVYTYVNFYNAHLTSPLISQYDTWIANTGVSTPNFTHPYTMWQYQQTVVPGVLGAHNNACDLDYCYVDYSNSSGTTTPASPTSGIPSNYFQSDTTGTYTFGSNSVYYYKITTPDTYQPSAVSSNPSAVTVAFSQRLSDGFLYKITNVGSGQSTITTTAGDGRSASFVAVGTATTVSTQPDQPAEPSTPAAPATSESGTLVSDTTAPYTFGSNSAYYYKITTSEATAPTAVSSNSSAVSVSFSKKVSDGYLYKITNAGQGTAVITTTAASGAAASFTAYGTASGSQIVSDTPAQFSMKLGSTYQFKFTPGSSSAYTFTSGNSSILKNVSLVKIGKDYFYKIKAVSKGCAGVYAQQTGKGGSRICIVTVS